MDEVRPTAVLCTNVSRNSLLTGRRDHAPNAIGMFPTIEGNVTSDDYPGDFFGIVLVLFGV